MNKMERSTPDRVLGFKHYQVIVKTMKEFNQEDSNFLNNASHSMMQNMDKVMEIVNEVSDAHNDLMKEYSETSKGKISKFDSLEKRGEAEQEYWNKSVNYVMVLFEVYNTMLINYDKMINGLHHLYPQELILSDDIFNPNKMSPEDITNKMTQLGFNRGTIMNYYNAIIGIDSFEKTTLEAIQRIKTVFNNFNKYLVDRHSKQGVEIQIDPIITDFAISIYDNIDRHGEIQSGSEIDSISAYTLRKAEILANLTRAKYTNQYIDKPESMLQDVTTHIGEMLKISRIIKNEYNDKFNTFDQLFNNTFISNKGMRNNMDLNEFKTMLEDLNPKNVSFVNNNEVTTDADRFGKKFRNDSIKRVVEMIKGKTDTKQMVKEILMMKKEMRDFYLKENSFFTCKIGSGNQFQGIAPGALEVIPAARPTADLKHIYGQGFAEIVQFMDSIKSSKRWTDLFMATSPSKSTDKANVLLIGPQGCGKTEVLRAVGGQKDSIGVFAQGSDFLTCWSGEAEKNPKRMFEEGVKLSKESGMHVHFLLDEVDSVMNSDMSHGKTNLTLEFQILMDGVVRYPNLSIWGATNNPERIPMPMIRRFNKVVIVGELNVGDRINLFKHFLSFLPLHSFTEESYLTLADLTDGATGDVVRKIIDEIWRTNINKFVKAKPHIAEEIVAFLNRENKFSIDDFTKENRIAFNLKLGAHMVITPNMVIEETKKILSNVAIAAEITTAINTYARAKSYLSGIDHGMDMLKVREDKPSEMEKILSEEEV
jgi:hypothetical protein